MGTEIMTDAQRVAADHADTLQRFGGWVDSFGAGSPTRADVAALADDDDADTDDRAAARAALAWIDENGADDLSWSAFIDGALDIEISGRFDASGWEVTSVALLVSYGGPTVRYVCDDSSACELRVEVAWWSDRAELTMLSELAGYLWEIADERVQAVTR